MRSLYSPNAQPLTGHTREPDPTHNELKHTTTPHTQNSNSRTNAATPNLTLLGFLEVISPHGYTFRFKTNRVCEVFD